MSATSPLRLFLDSNALTLAASRRLGGWTKPRFRFVRHAADVPVLLSAVNRRPDWLVTHNIKHFSPAVAQRTALRIATPLAFFHALARKL